MFLHILNMCFLSFVRKIPKRKKWDTFKYPSGSLVGVFGTARVSGLGSCWGSQFCLLFFYSFCYQPSVEWAFPSLKPWRGLFLSPLPTDPHVYVFTTMHTQTPLNWWARHCQHTLEWNYKLKLDSCFLKETTFIRPQWNCDIFALLQSLIGTRKGDSLTAVLCLLKQNRSIWNEASASVSSCCWTQCCCYDAMLARIIRQTWQKLASHTRHNILISPTRTSELWSVNVWN